MSDREILSALVETGNRITKKAIESQVKMVWSIGRQGLFLEASKFVPGLGVMAAGDMIAWEQVEVARDLSCLMESIEQKLCRSIEQSE